MKLYQVEMHFPIAHTVTNHFARLVSVSEILLGECTY